MSELNQNENLINAQTGEILENMDYLKIVQNDIFLWMHKTGRGCPCRMTNQDVVSIVDLKDEVSMFTIRFAESEFIFRCLRYQLLLDDRQREIINRTINRRIYVYNNMANDEKTEYKKTGKCNIKSYDNYRLADKGAVDHLALWDTWWSVKADLDRSFSRKIPYFPMFKRNSDDLQSYWIHRDSIEAKKNMIFLPNMLNWVNCKPISFVPDSIKPSFATVIRDGGKYSAVVTFLSND
jgi:hypothetical protein